MPALRQPLTSNHFKLVLYTSFPYAHVCRTILLPFSCSRPPLHNNTVSQLRFLDRLRIIIQRAIRESRPDRVWSNEVLRSGTMYVNVTKVRSVSIRYTPANCYLRVNEISQVPNRVRQIHPSHHPRPVCKPNLNTCRWFGLIDLELCRHGRRFSGRASTPA